MSVLRHPYATLNVLIFSVFAALPTFASAIEPEATVDLIPMQATYRASLEKGIPFKGSATRTLKQLDDGSWIDSFKVESFIADIHESSRFRWDGIQAHPDQYRYALEGLMIPDRHRDIDFNWADQQANGDYEGHTIDMAFPDDALDPLSYQLQLRQDIKRGLTEMHYRVVTKNRIDEDEFAVVGTEILDTDFGKIETIKATKVRDPDSKRKTLLWFAPEWDYLLVRLLQIETDGSRYEIHLDDAKLNGQSIQTPPKS